MSELTGKAAEHTTAGVRLAAGGDLRPLKELHAVLGAYLATQRLSLRPLRVACFTLAR